MNYLFLIRMHGLDFPSGTAVQTQVAFYSGIGLVCMAGKIIPVFVRKARVTFGVKVI